jgi:hypothetical protein
MIPEPPQNKSLPPAVVPVLSYATPGKYQAEIQREGRYIVLPHGMDLPDRCVRCGKEAAVRYSISMALVIPIKEVVIKVGMCRMHARERQKFYRWRYIKWTLPGLAIYGVLVIQWLLHRRVSWFYPDQLAAVGGVFAVVLAIICLAPFRPIWCQRANATHVWIGGAGEPFLASLQGNPPEARDAS